jgi:hypothetical protein
LTFFVFIKSPTSLTFRGDIRVIRNFALISIVLVLFLYYFSLPVSGMAMECPRRRKLSQFVTNHFLCDKDGDKLFPIVDRKGVSYKVRHDSRSSRPGFDDLRPFDNWPHGEQG